MGIRGLACSLCRVGAGDRSTPFLAVVVRNFRALSPNPRDDHEMAPAYDPVPQATQDAGEIRIHARGRIRDVVRPEVWTSDPSSSEAASSPMRSKSLSSIFSL